MRKLGRILNHIWTFVSDIVVAILLFIIGIISIPLALVFLGIIFVLYLIFGAIPELFRFSDK